MSSESTPSQAHRRTIRHRIGGIGIGAAIVLVNQREVLFVAKREDGKHAATVLRG